MRRTKAPPRVADELFYDLVDYGQCMYLKIDTPDLFVIERIPPWRY
jgi:hypothetical protein